MFGFVLRRARGRLPLAVAMLLTVLITTTVLTCLQAFGRSVGDAGVRRALQGPGYARTTVLVTANQGIADRRGEDATVGAFAHRIFAGIPVRVDAVSHSRSYGLPGTAGSGAVGSGAAKGTNTGGGSSSGDPDLTMMATLSRDRVRLLAGRWPAPVSASAPGSGATATLEVAVPRAELTRLRLTDSALPAKVRLADRFGGAPRTVTITGVYRATDASAPYWRLDPYSGKEIQLSSFVSYGPMLVDDSAFTTGLLPQDGRSWLIGPDMSNIRSADIDALSGRIDAAVADVQRGSALNVQTDLAAELGDVRSGARTAWSNELIGSLQLALLAAVALLLVTRLIMARQAGEDALLTARGATRRRVGLLTGEQSLLLALPAAVLAPPLTPPLLRLLRHSYGPLAHVPLDFSLTWTMWLVAAVCALACVVLTGAPALVQGTGGLLQRAGRRQALVGGAARSGADLALIALAFLAYQELGHIGGDVSGGLGVDPVAVAAPSLALCAGTVVVLRLLPFMARLGGRLAARGNGLSAALVGWQLARRPGRTAGPTLLLVLAVATGVLALGEHASWSASQADQASFATANGLRIWGSTLPSLGQSGRFGSLPGGDRIIAVSRTSVSLTQGGSADLLALDAQGVAAHLPIRSDLLAGRSMQQLFGPLALPAPHGAAAGIPLPGRPERIDLNTTGKVNQFTPGPPSIGPTTPPGPMIELQVRDRFGAVHVLLSGNVSATGSSTLSVPLSAAAQAPLGEIAWPLTLVGLEVQLPPNDGYQVDGDLTVRSIAVAQSASGPATTLAMPSGLAWSSFNPVDQSQPMVDGPPVTVRPAPGVLSFGYNDISNSVNATFSTASSTTSSTASGTGASGDVPAKLPALATQSYLDAVGASVGDDMTVSVGDANVVLHITGALPALPTTSGSALVVDLASLTRQLAPNGAAPPEPTEWWLPAASPQDHTPVAAAAVLRALPGTQNLQVREEVSARLTQDPLSAGPQVTLVVLALVAAILAAIGFGAATAAAASERTREHAILLALGCPPRRLARTAAAEPALLIALGTTVGLGLGALIVRLVVPLVVLTPTGRPPVPPVVVTLPFGQTLVLLVAITLTPVLTAFLSGRRSAATRPRPLEEL